MKHLLGLLITLTTASVLFSQTPESFKYQAIVRDTEGNVISNQDVAFRISILQGSTNGASVYSEVHSVTTNRFGLVNLQIGNGTRVSGNFSGIDWGINSYFLKLELDETGGSDYSDLGTTQLLSVPYALHAGSVTDKNDADADPENEIQDITLSGNTLSITLNGAPTQVDLTPYLDNTDEQIIIRNNDTLSISNGNSVVLPYDSSQWKVRGDNLIYTGGNVGIGSRNPRSKLEVQGDISFTELDTLFSVKDKEGNVVFAVFPDGAKVYVNNSGKGNVGGFAVSGRSTLKYPEYDLMRITPDSARIYVSDTSQKGTVGGFAISGRSTTKQGDEQYLYVAPTNTQVYVNQSVKGTVGGFAVSGRSASKGIIEDILVTNPDSTRIFVNDTLAGKGNVGGFAISGRSTGKNQNSRLMSLTKNNYFIGHEAGTSTTTGMYNSFFGYNAGYSNTIGNRNTFMGYYAGYTNIDGYSNIFIGDSAGYFNENGNSNIFIGNTAGKLNNSGYKNIFFGNESGHDNQTGRFNVFIGDKTGVKNTTGQQNVIIGATSGYYNTTGYRNVFVGNWCGYSNTIGSENIFFGNRSGWNNNEGSNNIFMGSYSGFTNTIAGNNIFIGNSSGYLNEIGSENIFIGKESGYSNIEGDLNVCIGFQSGYSLTTGNYNSYLGFWSGFHNTTGTYNTFLGAHAGYHNTTSINNTFIGSYAASDDTCGTENTIIGAAAGRYSSGNNNTFIGAICASQTLNTHHNVYVGGFTGRTNEYGNYNVFMGHSAGYWNKGSNNVFLGHAAGADSHGSNNVFIGYLAGQSDTGSDKLYIENSEADSTGALIYGDFYSDLLRFNANVGIGRISGTNDLEVEGTASKTSAGDWLANSDRRIKTDIQDIDNAFEMVSQLHPVKFHYSDQYRTLHPSVNEHYYYNFIAQEYREVFPESVRGSGEYLEGDENEILQLDSYNAQVVTIKAVQELIKENKELKRMLFEMNKRLSKLEHVDNPE